MSGVTAFGRYGVSVENGYACGYYVVSPSWYSRPPAVRNLLDHASFEDGALGLPGQNWAPINGANLNVLTAPSPLAGAKFLQTGGSGSVIQTIPSSIAPGESYIFSIWARVRQGYSGGAAGTLRLKAQGSGGPLEYVDKAISVTSGWQLISTSVDLIHGHSELYAEVLLNVNRPIDIDTTEVIQVTHKKASFEVGDFIGPSYWQFSNPGIMAYDDKCDGGARVGACHLELSKSQSVTASMFQDVKTYPAYGDSFTFSTWLRKGAGATGTLSGTIVLWALGGSQESAITYFSLPDTTWRQWSVTMEPLNGRHTGYRAEIYLDQAGKNFQIDGTRVFNNQLAKTSFETGAAPEWSQFNAAFAGETTPSAKDAAKVMKVSSTAPGGFFLHNWPVEVRPQDSLTFVAWVRCKATCSPANPISGNLVIAGPAGEQPATTFILTSTTTWVPVIATIDATTADAPRQARIYVLQTGRDIAVDAVSQSTTSGG